MTKKEIVNRNIGLTSTFFARWQKILLFLIKFLMGLRWNL